jgi:hypothetical protein
MKIQFSPRHSLQTLRDQETSAPTKSHSIRRNYCHRNNQIESECRTKIRDLERTAPPNQSQSKSDQMPNQPQYQQTNQQKYQQPGQQFTRSYN